MPFYSGSLPELACGDRCIDECRAQPQAVRASPLASIGKWGWHCTL